jgi:hypothetical protein
MEVHVTLVAPHLDPGGVMQPYHLNTNVTIVSLFEQEAEDFLPCLTDIAFAV